MLPTGDRNIPQIAAFGDNWPGRVLHDVDQAGHVFDHRKEVGIAVASAIQYVVAIKSPAHVATERHGTIARGVVHGVCRPRGADAGPGTESRTGSRRGSRAGA